DTAVVVALRQLPRQGKGGARTVQRKVAEDTGGSLVEFTLETVRRGLQQALRLGIRKRPHDGTGRRGSGSVLAGQAGQRQQRQRTGGKEPLPGGVPVRARAAQV